MIANIHMDLSERDFVTLFTPSAPIVFAYHGYPRLIHRLTYRQSNHDNLHVRGYKEEGTTTTPFDMCVLNEIDRFSLAIDAIDRVPQLRASAAHTRQELVDKIIEHKHYIRRNGEDMPEKRWTDVAVVGRRRTLGGIGGAECYSQGGRQRVRHAR